MRKILDLDERFYGTGEPTLSVVARARGRGWQVEKTAHHKTASPAFDYIQSVTPREGTTIILVNALGAYETYDDNRNGDAFPEQAYRVGKPAKCGHPQCTNELRGWVEPSHVLTEHYKTFEAHGGIYKHHVNKDPGKSLGKVEQAFWNPYMHRVELLLAIRNALDPELVQRINDGDYPAVSMGCHVRYDVCSICGHRAPTRKDYCEHAKFRMREILADTGERVCVLNPMPKFFDISIVHRPADPTGFMLKKVAHEVWTSSAERGEKVAAIEEKQARVRKFSAIQKELIGETDAVRSGPDIALVRKYRREMLPEVAPGRKRLGPQDLLAVGDYSVPQVVSSLAAKNAALTAGEFADLYLRKLGFVASEGHLDRIVALQPYVHEVYARYPALIEKFAGLVEADSRHVRVDLQRKLAGWIAKRAAPLDWVQQQAFEAGGPLSGTPMGSSYQASESPRTDLVTLTDPNTGEVYRTTRGAAQAAHGTNVRGLLGATAMISGALGLVNPVLGLASAPVVYGGLKHLTSGPASPYTNSRYDTDQGLRVPGNTEFVKSSSTQDLAVSATTMLNKLAYDYLERLPHADLGRSLHAQLLAKVAARPGTPFAVLTGSPASLETKVAVLCAPAEHACGDATESPDVDVVRLTDQLGTLIER